MDSKGAIPNLVSVFFRRLVVLIVLRVDAIKKRNLTWHRRFRRDGTAQSKYYDCLHRSHRKVFIAMMLIRGIFSVRLGKRSPGFNLSRGALAALGLLVICGSLEFAVAPNARANDPRDPWFFTAKEVQAAYQYQENYGGRIRYPLRPEACFLGREEFVLSHGGAEFTVPCHFIAETTRHLQEMLSAGAARYLFPFGCRPCAPGRSHRSLGEQIPAS